MANLAKFNNMVGDFDDVADFVVIYIAEAHPTDGWAIPGNIEISNHKGMQDRMKAARHMVELEPPPCPVVVDCMCDEANVQYTALPERLYIIKDGRIVYHGDQGPFGYKLNEVRDWLTKWKSS